MQPITFTSPQETEKQVMAAYQEVFHSFGPAGQRCWSWLCALSAEESCWPGLDMAIRLPRSADRIARYEADEVAARDGMSRRRAVANLQGEIRSYVAIYRSLGLAKDTPADKTPRLW